MALTQQQASLLLRVRADNMRAQNCLRAYQDALSSRDESIRLAVESGVSQRRVSIDAGITRPRVHSIVHHGGH